ncbi:ABC transporter substrate-binding protein [Pelomonas sp. KK5]|uniref:substrate-binding periplasmic protein n=1 Tax=Pelomonas sp. KK5 TaxID=1855730 RepID=UPI0009FAD30A|nr:transporter substrate-binding domain-containing protein [Pelomonas sp. KK5]
MVDRARRCLLGLPLIVPAAVARAADETPETSLTVLAEPVRPYSYQDADGRPTGYAIELMQEMLRRCRLGSQVEFNSWTSAYQRALAEPRVLLVSIVRLPEREPYFYWLGPTASRRAYLYRLKSRADVRVSTLDSVRGYRIGVIRDDATERDLLARGFELGRQLDRSPDHAALLRKLFAGRCDLIALNSTVAAATFESFGYDFGRVEPVLKLSDFKLYMGLSRSSTPALHARLQAAWESMRRDGTVAALAARYPAVSLQD